MSNQPIINEELGYVSEKLQEEYLLPYQENEITNEKLPLIRRMLGRVGLVLALAISSTISHEVLIAESQQAEAATVNDYPWANAKDYNPGAYEWWVDENPYNGKYDGEWELKDPQGYYYRNCTSYAAWRIDQEFGKNISGWGNAEMWDDNARRAGYAVDVGGPEPGDIGVRESRHVVIVESVNPDGSVNYSDYNRVAPGKPGTGTGRFDHYIDINGEGTGLNGASTGTSAPSKAGEGGGNVASWSVGRLDVFSKDTNATGPNLYTKYFEHDKGWSGNGLLSDSTGIRMASQPVAVSWGPNRVDVFARSEGNLLIHKRYDGRWYPWETFAGCIKGTPSVASWGPNRLDIFARNCNSTGPNLMHKWWDGSWKGWETVPNAPGRVASISVVSPEPNRIDIFGIDQNNNNLLHNWFKDGWKPQESLGGCLTDELAVTSWAPTRFDIFAEGCNTSGQNTYHKWFDNGWNDWELLPGANNMQVVKMLGAISWANQRIDVMARGTNGELLHKWWNGSWSPWESLGGTIAP